MTCLIGYLLPGLDHRFGWSHLPLWLTILSQAFVLGGCLMVFWVLKANSFAAATIRVEPDQKVISSGPYRIVRHPMYLGASVMFLFAPLALGSYFALPVFALFIPIIVFRLLNEGKVLRQELPGYAEYCLHTRFRLVPLFWLSPPLRTLTCWQIWNVSNPDKGPDLFRGHRRGSARQLQSSSNRKSAPPTQSR